MTSGSTSPGFEDEGFASFLFNFDQFETMDAVGVFAKGDGRVELIDGEVFQTAPAGADHSDIIMDLAVDLTGQLKDYRQTGLRVVTQATLKVDDFSAPEPDVFVARRTPGQKYYLAADAALVVEVSVSTAQPDRSVERPLYARAGIPELWIVDPASRSIHVHRQPNSDGTWSDIRQVTEGSLSPLFEPRIVVALDDVFQSL